MTRMLVLARLVWLETLRRKDLYVLLVLLGGFLLGLVSLDAFGITGRVSYVKDAGLLMTWLFAWLLAIAVSVRQLPQEERHGTIFILLAKPVRRVEIVVGKWLGAWTVTVAATLVFYGFLAGIVALNGGAFGGKVLAQGLALHAALLAAVTALGIACSTRLHADAAAALSAVISLAAWILPERVPDLVPAAPGPAGAALSAAYYLLPHFELFDLRRRLAYGWEPAAGGAVAAVLLYGTLLAALFLLLGWLGYRRKRFRRGDVS